MKRIKLGDIFEINTPKGKAYLHFIYKDSVLGELIRVLPGLYSDRPVNLGDLAKLNECYMVSFPLAAAVKKTIVIPVGFYPASDFSKPRFMREEHIVRDEFLGWFIVDTDTWKRQLVKNLTPEQKKYSPWGIWNDTLLVESLVNDWKLEEW